MGLTGKRRARALVFAFVTAVSASAAGADAEECSTLAEDGQQLRVVGRYVAAHRP